jgi:hypothetical protein
MLCGISSELAGCVPPYSGLRAHDSRLRLNQTLVRYMYLSRLGLAKPAKLNFFKTPASTLHVGKRRQNTPWLSPSWSFLSLWAGSILFLTCFSPVSLVELITEKTARLDVGLSSVSVQGIVQIFELAFLSFLIMCIIFRN